MLTIGIILVSLFFSLTAYAAQNPAIDIANQMLRNDKRLIETIANSDSKLETIKEQYSDPLGSLQDTYASLLASIVKTTANTINPQNTECFRVPEVAVKGNNEAVSKGSVPSLDQMSLFTYNFDEDLDIIVLAPLIAYKDSKGNLVVWTTIDNFTGHDLQLDGLHRVELSRPNGEIVASGEAEMFSEPMVYSKRPDTTINLGVYNGLPDGSFCKIIFAPGTFKTDLDASALSPTYISYDPEIKYLD